MMVMYVEKLSKRDRTSHILYRQDSCSFFTGQQNSLNKLDLHYTGIAKSTDFYFHLSLMGLIRDQNQFVRKAEIYSHWELPSISTTINDLYACTFNLMDKDK